MNSDENESSVTQLRRWRHVIVAVKLVCRSSSIFSFLRLQRLYDLEYYCNDIPSNPEMRQ